MIHSWKQRLPGCSVDPCLRNKGSLLYTADILYEFYQSHSLHKTLFVIYYVPSSVLGTGDAKDLDFQELLVYWRRQTCTHWARFMQGTSSPVIIVIRQRSVVSSELKGEMMSGLEEVRVYQEWPHKEGLPNTLIGELLVQVAGVHASPCVCVRPLPPTLQILT